MSEPKEEVSGAFFPESEFVEDTVPDSKDSYFTVLSEDFRPESGDSFTTKRVPPTHDQETRKTLALIILWALVISHGIGFFAFAFGFLDNEKFTIFVTGFSGLQALAAAAVGFYYGSNQSDN